MREGNFDVVHAWEEPYIYAGYQIARSLRGLPARFVFRTAQNLLKRYPPPFSYFERATLQRAQGWIAGGNLVFETMLKRGYPKDRGRLITLAVDTKAFRPWSEEEKKPILSELGIKAPVLGFVGRFSRNKGLKLLMNALDQLPRTEAWSLLLLGSGPYKNQVQAWARARGWQDRVRVLLAPHDQAPRYIAAMDVLLAPSQTTRRWREQFGRMIVEAFASGVPVIGSDSGEIPFVIGDAGRVVAERDPSAWAHAIQELLEDRAQRTLLSQKGLQRVERDSSFTVAAQVAEFYRWLAEQPVTATQERIASTVPMEPIEPSVVAAPRILGFATQGAGGNEEARLRELFGGLSIEILPFRRQQKIASAFDVLKRARGGRHDLLVMEGTGSAGGLALFLARWLYGVPYVVSSGDAVAPFLAMRWPAGWLAFFLYEWLLYQNSRGFIGWTPYLVGRALTMGAPRAITAAGWALHLYSPARLAASRSRVRRDLGIPENAIVFGICGSLVWSKHRRYCYGQELVQAGLLTESPAIRVLIVGEGDGRNRLRAMAGSKLDKTIFLPGRVPHEEVPDYLAAIDIGSLPQSVDRVGSFRYTTKLSEYFSVRLPIVTNEIPAAYDLDYGGTWRLPGKSPWDARFVQALADLMNHINTEAIALTRSLIPNYLPEFDRDRQIARVTEFVREILG